MGLEYVKDYSDPHSLKTLRYGKLIMADQVQAQKMFTFTADHKSKAVSFKHPALSFRMPRNRKVLQSRLCCCCFTQMFSCTSLCVHRLSMRNQSFHRLKRNSRNYFQRRLLNMKMMMQTESQSL